MAETATITVMMTDLVGSTELLRHGADAFDEIRRAHLEAVRGVLSEHEGEEVKTTGDGVMATFTSAAEAVGAAVAIEQVVDRLHRRDPRSPAVRVGLASGEAASEDGDWYGPPVIEAARLCAAAEGGQILATAVVALLVGTRGGHRFVDLGERQLKGFDEPTPLVAVPWTPAADPDQLPLPPAAVMAADGFLVGRDGELDELCRAWKAATGGHRRILLISGEPGVGKTRLVGELSSLAHTEGATVLWGRCDEEVGVAYQPFVEALRHWARHRSEPDVSGPGDHFGLAPLLPELGEVDAVSDAAVGTPPDEKGERLRLFDGVGQLLVDLSGRGPVLVVIDDVHWAATPTLLLLRHLVRDPHPAPLLIVATYRDTDLDRTHPLAGVLADLRRQPAVDRLPVAGLAEAGVAAYLDAAAGEQLGDAGAELATAIHRETEGNPFFVGQVLRHLVESGALVQRDGRWTTTAPIDDIGIPEGVREVVGRRLSRLSAEANKALAVAAVMGREFDLRTLQAVPDAGDPDALLDAVEEAVTARLVDETSALERFVFSHALVRHTLLFELTAARRARIHRRLGEAMARRRDPVPSVVAHHLCSGITEDSAEDAVRWAGLAIEDCRARLAAEEAVAIGERAMAALELLDDPPPALWAELLLPHAGVLQYLGDIDRAKELADDAVTAARAAGAPALFARAVGTRVSWARAGVPDPEADALLTEALEGLGDRDPHLRATLLSVRALYLGINQNQGAAAADDAAAAVDLLRDGSHPDALLGALFVHGSVLQSTPDLGRQLAVLDEIRRVEAGAPDAVRRFNVLSRNRLAVVLAMQSGDRGGVEHAIAEVVRTAQHRGSGRLPRALSSMWQAMVGLAEGRFDDAEADAAALLEIADDINFQNSWAALVFRIALERGQAADFVPIIRDAATETPDLVALRTALARALIATGELDEARAIFHALAPDRFSAVPRDIVFSSSVVDLTEACLVLGERRAAEDLHRLLLPYSGQLQVTAWGVHCLGAIDRYLAMTELLLGRHDDADAHLDSALALEESFGATALATRTRLWWARLLVERAAPGDAERAAVLAADAEQAARSIGQTGVAADAAAIRDTLGTPA